MSSSMHFCGKLCCFFVCVSVLKLCAFSKVFVFNFQNIFSVWDSYETYLRNIFNELMSMCEYGDIVAVSSTLRCTFIRNGDSECISRKVDEPVA